MSPRKILRDVQPQNVARRPRHIAIIMDGNGRWARRRGLPRLAGHRAGTENIRRIVEACVEEGIEILTLYAFSTENWSRPAEEVQGLLGLLSEAIERETERLHQNGVQVRHIGRLEGLPEELQRKILQAVERTRDNRRLILNVAFNYGGRAEIVDAARRLIAAQVPAEEITEERFASALYTAGCPDPDLIIRTAGEMRLSNFLIWQAAYSEFYSTPTLWPDFDREELRRAIEAYGKRVRKFGGLEER
ncbi:MAG: isoprenyl transferase [Chloroflexia bacterium]